MSEERLRDVAARATEATEQERARVARELHDGVGQVMTALRLGLQVLDATLPAGDPARPRVVEAGKLVDEAMDEVRRIAMNLHPAALDRLGLVEALGGLCEGVASRAGVPVSFAADPLPAGLPTAVEAACYRVVQEGLNNSVRYADASGIDVRLEARGDRVAVSVTDDGRGFDATAPRRGLGLRGMEDRAALLGGDFDLRTAPEEGTSVRASFPVAAKVSL
jgi:signal transduction histidine kinase